MSIVPEELNLEMRDPNGINEGLKIAFEDVLAEPDGIRSLDCVWKMSFKCFTFWKTFCYNLVTVCCGMCMAAYWGCEFAGLAVYQIWGFTPWFRIASTYCSMIQRIWQLIVGCCLEPICVSCSKCLEPLSGMSKS